MAQISDLIGKNLTAVEREGDDRLIFTCKDGKRYFMYHEKECCERVSIDDINGDLQDLVGSPITLAEERISNEHIPERLAEKQKEKEKAESEDGYYYDSDESFTWTFYKLATIKGYVDIRWFGSSNGYYSERVDFIEECKSHWDD